MDSIDITGTTAINTETTQHIPRTSFPAPIGAIWQHGNNSMSVKINCYREKYIAIKNSKRKRDSDPSFFIHVYKTHTGATPVPVFRDHWTRGGDHGNPETRTRGIQDSVSEEGKPSSSETGIQMGTENVSQDPDRDERSASVTLGSISEITDSTDHRNET